MLILSPCRGDQEGVSSRGLVLLALLRIGVGRVIASSRMKPCAVVKAVNRAGNGLMSGCLAIIELFCPLSFETAKDALDHGSIPAVAAPPHARHQAMGGEQLTEAMAAVGCRDHHAAACHRGLEALSARQTSASFIASSRHYPSTCRARRCITTAKYIHPCRVGKYVISATQAGCG